MAGVQGLFNGGDDVDDGDEGGIHESAIQKSVIVLASFASKSASICLNV